MRIHFNGDTLDLPTATTVATLLDQQGLSGRRIAVEINGVVVPRSRHALHAIFDGDRVEVVHALGGG